MSQGHIIQTKDHDQGVVLNNGVAFDDNRSNDEVDILVWLNEGEVVIVVCNEGAYVHVIPCCIAQPLLQ